MEGLGGSTATEPLRSDPPPSVYAEDLLLYARGPQHPHPLWRFERELSRRAKPALSARRGWEQDVAAM